MVFSEGKSKSMRLSKRYASNAYLLEITHNNDRLFMNDLINDYYYYRDNSVTEPKTTTSIFLFTDRSLYRPGQTVYFKGIVLKSELQQRKKHGSMITTTTTFTCGMPITRTLIL